MNKVKILLVLILGIGGWWSLKQINDNDFRIGIVEDSGIVLETVSMQRRMINSFEVKGEVMVWIPQGLGWYRSDKIKNILEQEKKTNLIGKVFFYNFGFVPDVIVYKKDNWWLDQKILVRWGLANYVRFLVEKGRMMIKVEVIDKELMEDTSRLGMMLQRDVADSQILKENIRLNVYNLGQSSGMGAFMARCLEWAGLTVVGVDSAGEKMSGLCRVDFGCMVDNTNSFTMIKNNLPDCEYRKIDRLNNGEIELYFGEEFSKMLNYDTYVRTF